MAVPQRVSLEQIIAMAEVSARAGVRTQYACEVVGVSEDGRFVDLVHNLLEWQSCPDGSKVLKNGYGEEILCAPIKPWIVTDIPVEQPYLRGQWNIRTRPRIGDKGVLSVFYHDIGYLKEKGGFQTPRGLRTMKVDSASWRPGLPNHADVNAESAPYSSDDQWELQGDGVSVQLVAPNNTESESNRELNIKIGGVSLSIVMPQNGAPTVSFNAPDGAITVNAKTANVNLTESATVTVPTTTITGNVTIDGTVDITGATTLASTLDVTGATTVGANLDVTGNVTGAAVAAGAIDLASHTHICAVPGAPSGPAQ